MPPLLVEQLLSKERSSHNKYSSFLSEPFDFVSWNEFLSSPFQANEGQRKRELMVQGNFSTAAAAVRSFINIGFLWSC